MHHESPWDARIWGFGFQLGEVLSLDWAPYTGRYDLITPGSQDRFCVQSWRLWHEGWRIVGEMVVTPRTLQFTTSILAYFSWCLAEAWSCSIVVACCTMLYPHIIATSFSTAYHVCACSHQLKWSICFSWSDLLKWYLQLSGLVMVLPTVCWGINCVSYQFKLYPEAGRVAECCRGTTSAIHLCQAYWGAL